MTDQDKRAFRDLMRRAGVAFNAAVDDAQLAVYWDGLNDLELATLTEAFKDCQESLRFFPRIVDLRDAEFGVRSRGEQQAHKQLLAKAPEDPHQVYCTSCEDTGFERGLDCPGDGRCHVGNCGRPGHLSYPHPFTRKCYCRPSNPVLAKQRERLLASVHKREAKHDRA